MRNILLFVLFATAACTKAQTGILGVLSPTSAFTPASLSFSLYNQEHIKVMQPANQVARSASGLTASTAFTEYPKGPWWTAEGVITASSGRVVVGLVKDANNYIGAVYDAGTQKISYVIKQGGVETLSGWTPAAYPNPTMRIVCTGTYLIGYAGTTMLGVWNAESVLDCRLKTIYGGTWKYNTIITGTASVNFTAGYFGGTAVGDNSIITKTDGTPLQVGNKVYWAGSLRGVYPDSDIAKLLKNNQSAILSYDLATNEKRIESYIWNDFGDAYLHGEGSPQYKYHEATATYHDFTPSWHKIAQYGFTLSGTNATHVAHGSTTSNILSGAHVIAKTDLVGDPATPWEYAYDPGVHFDGGEWYVCYATQRNAWGDPNWKMNVKIVKYNSAFTTSTLVYDGTNDAGLYEGVDNPVINGVKYFACSGYSTIQFRTLSGAVVATINQPAEVSQVAPNNFPSHAAMFKATVGGVPKYVYIGFNYTNTDGHFAYGETFVYVSNTE
jgi:hypothetical protein